MLLKQNQLGKGGGGGIVPESEGLSGFWEAFSEDGITFAWLVFEPKQEMEDTEQEILLVNFANIKKEVGSS